MLPRDKGIIVTLVGPQVPQDKARADRGVVVAARQQTAVHLGVQRLDASVHHLREAGVVGDFLDLDVRVGELGVAGRVVHALFVGVGEHRVRLGVRLEDLRIAALVRVVLERQHAVRLLDLRLVGVLGHAKGLVVVLFRRRHFGRG